MHNQRHLQQHITAGSIEVYPVDKKIPAYSWTQKRGIKTTEELEAWLKKGYRAFAYVPARSGLLVIDIDRKNGRDGLSSLNEYLMNFNVTAKDIFKGYPVTKTPNNGFHIACRYTGPKLINNEPLDGVEIKHSSLVTLSGSWFKQGQYIQNDVPLNKAPEIPDVLKALLVEYKTYCQPIQLPETSDIDLNKMADIVQRQGNTPQQGGRNRYCFQLALYAAKLGKHESDVLNFLLPLVAPDFSEREIIQTVKSAYRIGNRRKRCM